MADEDISWDNAPPPGVDILREAMTNARPQFDQHKFDAAKPQQPAEDITWHATPQFDPDRAAYETWKAKQASSDDCADFLRWKSQQQPMDWGDVASQAIENAPGSAAEFRA
jgi:hypothetical protein